MAAWVSVGRVGQRHPPQPRRRQKAAAAEDGKARAGRLRRLCACERSVSVGGVAASSPRCARRRVAVRPQPRLWLREARAIERGRLGNADDERHVEAAAPGADLDPRPRPALGGQGHATCGRREGRPAGGAGVPRQFGVVKWGLHPREVRDRSQNQSCGGSATPDRRSMLPGDQYRIRRPRLSGSQRQAGLMLRASDPATAPASGQHDRHACRLARPRAPVDPSCCASFPKAASRATAAWANSSAA